MLNKLLNIFTKNKKNILLLSFLIIGFFYLGDTTFAAEGFNDINDDTKEKVGEVIRLRWIGSTITVFLSLLTYLAVMFLSPEWINGTLFGLNGYFKQIWILVSNVVYFVFAFILIWIAFMNIIGKGQDKYQLKQALPKFFIGIMIVPLSWFLVNFILSISSILTISAINLPYDTFPGFNSKIQEVNIPKDCTIDLSKESGESGTGEGESVEGDSGSTNSFFSCNEDSGTVTVGKLMDSSDSSSKIFSVLGTYAYGVIGLENIDQLNNFDQAKIKTILDLIVKLVFDVLFIVVYAVLMIALALVLMTRGIYIWIYMMISPLFGLMYFFDKSSGGGEFFDKFNIKQFISLAMVPVYTMLALTFGLLFIFVVAEGMAAGNTSQALNGFQSINLKDSKLTIGGENSEDTFSLEIKGAAANEENISEIWQTAVGEANGALGVIGTLIMKIFGIVVLWGAVMAALRTNEVTKAVVEPLHAFGTQVGQLATKSPQYAPIFGGQSMQSMKTAASNVTSEISSAQNRKGSELASKFFTSSEKDEQYKSVANSNPGDWNDAMKNIQNLNSLGDSREISKSRYAIEGYAKNLERLVEDGKIKDNEDVRSQISNLRSSGFGDPSVIREALSIMDNNASDPDISILGGNDNVVAGQVDDYLGNNGNNNQNQGNNGSNGNNNQIINFNVEQRYENSGKPKMTTLNGQDIMFEETGEVTDSYLDNMARAVNGMDETKFRQILEGKELNPDEIIGQLNDLIEIDENGNITNKSE